MGKPDIFGRKHLSRPTQVLFDNFLLPNLNCHMPLTFLQHVLPRFGPFSACGIDQLHWAPSWAALWREWSCWVPSSRRFCARPAASSTMLVTALRSMRLLPLLMGQQQPVRSTLWFFLLPWLLLVDQLAGIIQLSFSTPSLRSPGGYVWAAR